MYSDPVFDVSGAVAVLNQTLEMVYPTMTVVGELSNFKIAKGKWLYADIKDDAAKLRCFGTIYQLPGPLEDGMMVEVVAQPRLHQQFGFSLNIVSIRPVGEGAIKKAADLLREKLTKEGLFNAERKRPIPRIVERIGLVTSEQSAAYADFMKILDARWRGVEVVVADAQVQGESAPESITAGIQACNQHVEALDAIVVIRGGGSADDLSAFSDERVVRAVASSRTPTVVAIGHEIDESLAELAADMRASTPSNAAELLFLDRSEVSERVGLQVEQLGQMVSARVDGYERFIEESAGALSQAVQVLVDRKQQDVDHARTILESAHPKTVLKRGFALVEGKDGKLVSDAKHALKHSELKLTFQDGNVQAKVVK